MLLFSVCSIGSAISGSSDTYQSKVQVSSGLLEIVTQTNYILLWTMKDCSESYYDRNVESKLIKEALLLRNIN